jgi:hypothetical protein
MIDLTAGKSDGTGFLSKVQIRRDGNSDESLLFDIDIAFDIQTDVHADAADKLIPGAREIFNNSETGEERRITVRSTLPDSSLHLEIINQDGESIIATPAEVRSVVLQATGAGTVVTNRFRLFGLAVEDAVHLLVRLGKRITVCAERPQQVLDFPSTAEESTGHEVIPEKDAVPDEVATIVTYEPSDNNGHSFGMLVSDGEGPLVEISNFSTLRSVPRDSIVSSLQVRGPIGVNLSKQLTKYHMESRQSSCSPDWKWIILSLGERYAGDLGSEDSLVIDNDLIQDAINKSSMAV